MVAKLLPEFSSSSRKADNVMVDGGVVDVFQLNVVICVSFGESEIDCVPMDVDPEVTVTLKVSGKSPRFTE